jgi:putative oxidoreductase
MKELIKDSLYTISSEVETGYKFLAIKFTVNGEFELKDKSNRRVIFNESGKTIYTAKYDFENK